MSAKNTLSTTTAVLTVPENSAATPIGILAPKDPKYAASKLTITVTALPTDGTIFLADGLTPVTLGEKLTAAQLSSLEFKPTTGAFGQKSTFGYTVADPAGATATGTATLAIAPDTIHPVTYAAALTVADTAAPTAIAIAAPSDSNYAASQLTVTITSLPTDGTVLLADGKTAVTAGQKLTVAQLTGLEFSPLASAAGQQSTLTYTVTDPSALSTNGTASLAVKGAVLTVGAGMQFATLAAAVAASHNGDVIKVQAGTYINDFATITTNITIEGVGGIANFVATEALPNGKAILVTDANVTIDNLAFSGAIAATDANGAGIRYETGNLTLNNDYFFNNQEGLLAGNNPAGSITITNSEFAFNGVRNPSSPGYGLTHNLYVGNIGTLTISGDYFRAAVTGNQIKSRANNTIIENTRIEDFAGTSSYEIDLPNGGNATILNNLIEQGTNTGNPIIINVGEEGSLLPGTQLTVSGNTIVNELNSPSVLAIDNHTTATAQLSNNQFYGVTAGQVAAGPNSQSGDVFLATKPTLDARPNFTTGSLPVTTAASLKVVAAAAATPIGILPPSDAAYPAAQLTVVVMSLPTVGTVLLADGVTPVSAGQTLTVAQLCALEFQPFAGVANANSCLMYEIVDPAGLGAIGTAALAVGAAAPVPAPATSPDGSFSTTGPLTTADGTWTLTPVGGILLNGQAVSGFANLLAVENGGHMYALVFGNSTWWAWGNATWTQTTDPSNGVITAGSGGSGSGGGGNPPPPTPPLTQPLTPPLTPPSGSGVDATPVLPQPAQAGDIVDVRLQNTGSAVESSGYVTFGEVFKAGAVQPTDTLVARLNGVNYAVQMDVKSTNADGSVRQAVLTLDAPSIAAGGTLDLMLAKGAATAPNPAAPSAAALLAAGYDVAVNFAFHNPDGSTTADHASAAAALQAALAGGTVQQWLAGSGVNEYDVATTVDGGKLKVEFDIRAYANGTTTTDVIFDNGWMFSSGKTDLNYDVTISQAGQQVYSAAAVPQYLYSTWDHQVASAGTVDPNVQYDVPYLEATGAIPAYDTSLGVSDASVQANLSTLTAANTGPLGTAGVTTYMPMTGGRNDIGAQPAWVAEALLSQNAAAQQVMDADASAAGSVPWHYTDEATGAPVNTQTYPTFWEDYRGTLVPTNGWPDSNPADPWTPDAAHMPDLSYVPYLTSGSQYDLTQLQAQADYALASTPPAYGDQWLIDGKYPAGFVLDGMNQQRTVAWDLRQVAEAAYATPDADPLKGYYVTALQSNMQALVQQYLVDGINQKYGQLEGFAIASSIVEPWEEDYLVTSLAEVAGMNIPQASAQAVQMLQWMNNFVAGLYTNGSNGFNPLNGPGYHLATMDPTTQAPYTTWAQFYSANVAQGNITPNPTQLDGYPLDTQGGYPEIAAAALADEITYTQSPQAIQAYGYVVSQIANDFAIAGTSETAAYQANPEWSQMPRLADGVYLTRSQMQIDTSANSLTLTATGGDSLLSVVGGGTDTLNGGTGGVDLLFGGTGNDTFNPGPGNDYLFGGSGKNTFNDNTGNNYFHGGGTANVYWFGEAHSGHDTIANFNTATDTLKIAANLNGNGLATAAQLIAAATTANGNTVLHLSPQDNVTLLGLASPASLANAILVS